MPLVGDGFPRGEHAIHVHPHGKLGRHRTVIKAALPLVNRLIDERAVARVELGRIVTAATSFTPRKSHTAKGTVIDVLIVGADAAQSIRVIAANKASIERIEKSLA